MLVRARWTIAYKGISYNGGEEFEMAEGDYPRFQRDVEKVVRRKQVKNKKTKQVKRKRTK